VSNLLGFVMPIPLPIAGHDAPEVPLRHLDQLWFQVAGTLCNLSCHHCFISCTPHNRSFGFLSLAQVREWLDESILFGVKEYYFTGGEPFLNPEMTSILELTLEHGPATVLTNGTVFREEWLQRLRIAEDLSPYSLEFRVSIDGCDAASNDPIRGEGTFARAMEGVKKLLEHGFLPIITIARMDDESNDGELLAGFVRALKGIGYDRPRVKILPPLRLGAEIERARGYLTGERVTREMIAGFDTGQLLCSHSRLISECGVHVCPILLEAPDGLLSTELAGALSAFPLRHHACYTCYQYGSICSNPTGGPHDA
jgi:molybdenum cofactor biosynthesis enzyme MoaA